MSAAQQPPNGAGPGPCSRRRCGQPRRSERGLSGLLVIAVMVMLGGLTTYSVGLVTSVHSGYAREISHARARQAAEAGAQWGRYRINNGAAAVCAAAQSITTLPGALQPYTVTVRCALVGSTNEAPAAAPINIYQISASACNLPAGGQCPNALATSDYVEAQSSARAER